MTEPSAEIARPKPFPTSWVIDVCRTCGRHATFPFCEHRNQPRPEGTSWCAPVRVTGKMSPASRLAPTTPPVPTDAGGRDDDH